MGALTIPALVLQRPDVSMVSPMPQRVDLVLCLMMLKVVVILQLSPPLIEQHVPIAVDWTTLIILEELEDDGLAKEIVDEDKVYEAM